MAAHSGSPSGGYVPVEPARVWVAGDGTLAAVHEATRVTIVELPRATAVAEIGVDPDAVGSDVAWIGTPPRLLVLSRYAASSTVHLLDPTGPRLVAELQLEAPMHVVSTVGAFVLVLGGTQAGVLSVSEPYLTLYPFPARTVPAVAGAAAGVFLVALAGTIEEWDPVSRAPRRRFRLPRVASISAVGGSERLVWFTTQQEPTRIDVIPLINRGQPKAHDLPEPIARIVGHPRTDVVACIGGETGRLYVVDLEGKAPQRVVSLDGGAASSALIVGRSLSVLAAQVGQPLAVLTLEGRAIEAEGAAVLDGESEVAARDATPVSEPDELAQGVSGVEMLGFGSQALGAGPQRVGRSGLGAGGSGGGAAGVGSGAAGVGSGASGVGSSGVGSGAAGVGSGAAGVGSGAAGVGSGAAGVGSGAAGVGSGASGAGHAGTSVEHADAGDGAGEAASDGPASGAASSGDSAADTGSDPVLDPLLSSPSVRPGPSVPGRRPAVPARSLWSTAASWRDDVVTWTRAVVAGSAAPTAPSAPLIDAVVARLALSSSLQPVIVLLYGSHLCGLRGAAPADVARVHGRRWDEALGRGELAARGVAQYADSRVELPPLIRRVLDELPPLTGVLIGEPSTVELPGPCAVVVGDESLAELAERYRARVGGAILVAERAYDVGAVVLEARLYGAAPMLRLTGDSAPSARAIFVVADARLAERLGLPLLS